jgi:uncharacterized protein (TIGR03437 family)
MKSQNLLGRFFSIPCAILIFSFLLVAHAQTPTLDANEQEFLKLINDYRTTNGVTALKVSISLTNASRWKSNDMGAKNYFGHNDLDGRDPFQRMIAFGYNYNTWLGENIAAGFSDASSTFTQWKNSPGHDRNMLDPNFKVVGIGRTVYPGTRYINYWTTDFGGEIIPTDLLEPTLTPVTAATTVNAANYQAPIAPDSIAATFGSAMATGTYAALSLPLPKTLGTTSVTVNGTAAELLYVSPSQINYLVPSTTAAGNATVEIKTGANVVARGTILVANVAPALFTITSDGKGIPAGFSTFDGVTLQALFNSDLSARVLSPGTAARPNFLVLFGTGIRKRTALSNVRVTIGGIVSQVDYAGVQGSYAGLDQLNILIPNTARGSGLVDLILTVDGAVANKVRVNIGN